VAMEVLVTYAEWAGIYGAGLSTLLAGARGYTWATRDRSRVKVTVSRMDEIDSARGTRVSMLVIQATNLGDHPVRVLSRGLERGKGKRAQGYMFDKGLPAEIRPRDSVSVSLPIAELEKAGIDLKGTQHGYVVLSTSEVFQSRDASLGETT
jgi:hypothetical protein